MERFVPYEKLSKKKRRELDRKRRSTWGSVSPVTRRAADPKAYKRQKARDWDLDDPPTVPFAVLVFRQPTGFPLFSASSRRLRCRAAKKRGTKLMRISSVEIRNSTCVGR